MEPIEYNERAGSPYASFSYEMSHRSVCSHCSQNGCHFTVSLIAFGYFHENAITDTKHFMLKKLNQN